MNWRTVKSRLDDYERLMRLDWPIGTLLLFWPTMWAVWLSSDGKPDWFVAWVFMLGAVLMHSLGCVINDYADRDFDPHVARTRDRPLAARRIAPWEALGLAVVLGVAALLLVWQVMTPCLLRLTVVAAFLALTYPFAKRFLPIPQAYLGVSFGLAIPMAYAAHRGYVPVEGWILLVGNMFWSIAYDTEYAMVDRPDDLRIGIRTSAITFGEYDVVAVMACYALAFLLIAWGGARSGMGLPFLAGILAACGLACHHYRLIRRREGPDCFRAFFGNNAIGAAIFAGIALDYLSRGVRPF
ncbi:MAG: 4-hydroxybenzoate octaprenyltransferase [Zoogloeaceae bacterium]|jgi:4-hydroxybenzoate polyprenyltransferase|nr:4-hydroxybenzoate octaprenyltransferase [Zoogloeaceae bacterium]